MKALTLWQPWASLVALGVKTIETRSWSTSYRGPLAIHAAKHVEYGAIGDYYAEHWFSNVRHVEDCYCDSAEIDVPCQRRATRTPCLTRRDAVATELPLGVVVATCTLVDVVPVGEDAPDTWPPAERQAHVAWDADGSGWANAVVIAGGGQSPERREGERPYCDYSPGRFAWLLADIAPLAEPVPARGRQQMWEWAA